MAVKTTFQQRLHLAVKKAGGPYLVAARMECSEQRVIAYLNGASLKNTTLWKLAAACEVPVRWLGCGEHDGDPFKGKRKLGLLADVDHFVADAKLIRRYIERNAEIISQRYNPSECLPGALKNLDDDSSLKKRAGIDQDSSVLDVARETIVRAINDLDDRSRKLEFMLHFFSNVVAQAVTENAIEKGEAEALASTLCDARSYSEWR